MYSTWLCAGREIMTSSDATPLKRTFQTNKLRNATIPLLVTWLKAASNPDGNKKSQYSQVKRVQIWVKKRNFRLKSRRLMHMGNLRFLTHINFVLVLPVSTVTSCSQ